MKTKLILILVAVIIAISANAQIPQNGLNANYEFTNGALTDAANAVNFSQTGTNLTNVNDRFATANNAVSLNGDYLTRSNVDYPNHVNFGSPYGQYGTVSFWIKTNTDDSNERIIIDDSNRSTIGSTTWTGYYIFLKDGKIGVSTRVRYAGSLGYQEATKIVTPYVSNGDWHHVAMTIGNTLSSTGASDILNTRAEIFIDGINHGRAAIDRVRSIASGGLQLNESHDSTGDFKVGNNRTNNLPTVNRYHDAIDDIYIYRREVTSAEVTQLATVNSFCFPPLPSIITVSNITETTADVSWTESGTFDLAYVIKGEPFTNATIISNINYTANTVQSLTGLQTSKIYNVYLRKPCTASLNSGWSSPKEFRSNGIIYVNKNATGINNGTSWVDAFTDLQDALSAAQANDKIWVAKGTYKPHATDVDVSFIANNTIYGGFAGTEIEMSDRDLSLIHTTNETILSGDLNNDDATTISFNNTTRDDNSKHVLEIATNNIEVNGFTIKDGNANGTGDDRFGAGIFKESIAANTTIKNCVIKNNVSSNSGAGLSITSLDDSIIIVDACIIENNLSPVGAGIDYHMSATGKTMNITVTNSLFNANKTDDNGGIKGTGAPAARFRAYFSGVTLTTTLVNNTFVNNSSKGDSGNIPAGNFPVVGLSNNDGDFGTLITANNIFWDNITNGNTTALSTGKTAAISGFPASYDFLGNNTDESNYLSSNNTNPNLDANFKLTAASTTEIDGGVNNQIPTGITTDLAGNLRIFNTTVDRGAYEFGSSVLGVDNFNIFKNEVSIYPNPTISVLNIKMDSNLKRATIYSVLGTKVLETTSKNIATSNLKRGLYLIKIEDEDGSISAKRFMKE